MSTSTSGSFHYTVECPQLSVTLSVTLLLTKGMLDCSSSGQCLVSQSSKNERLTLQKESLNTLILYQTIFIQFAAFIFLNECSRVTSTIIGYKQTNSTVIGHFYFAYICSKSTSIFMK